MKTPLDLTPYRGQWVAVKNGRLLGHHDTLVALMAFLHSLGPAASGAKGWYEAHPEEVQRWAVQAVDGRICANCRFNTREEAERGLQWLSRELPGAIVVTRKGQHDPWVDVEVTP